MKAAKYIIIITLLLSSCKKDIVFEKSWWWQGHWQNTEDTTYYFSVGSKPIGANEIGTIQFFISTRDSIYANFYVEDLIESDHVNKYKLIKTSSDMFLKIQEVEEEKFIEVYGPAISIGELESDRSVYRRMPEGVAPPIPDSVLRQ